MLSRVAAPLTLTELTALGGVSVAETYGAIYALSLPQAGQAFVSDTFSLRGPTFGERGGFRSDIDLLRLMPVLARAADAAAATDPFSVLTAATGGTQLHFRKQNELEDAISIVGVELQKAPAGAMIQCVNCGVYLPSADAKQGERGPLCGDPQCVKRREKAR